MKSIGKWSLTVLATETDRRTAQEILTLVASGGYGRKVFKITPGVAALLLINEYRKGPTTLS